MYDGINLLIRLEKLSRDRKWDGKLIEILVLLSRAMLISNNEVQALEYFEKAISLAEPEGYIRTFIDGGKSTQYLLQKIPRNSTNRDYVQKLLASFGSDQVSNQGNVPQLQVEPLSTREMDVLRMLATDQTGPDIAKEMHIALSTLRFHTRNIYSKMMVNNRRSAVRKARESQLI
jgi:LuxR family maltose regulon positive regulatory protein